MSIDSVNIRPGVNILSILQHLNYRPWFAIAEFVDNSLQSFVQHKNQLEAMAGHGLKLTVDIEIRVSDGGRIVIRDDAAGIHTADYARAFRPAEVPPDSSGLSEFGMGMKSAACWFAKTWTVRTKALGEEVERTLSFDIAKIVHDKLEELKVKSRDMSANRHYTEITLTNLHRIPQGRTIAKIKEHLTCIYRMFIREDLLDLRFDGETLTYVEPKVLKAPYYKTPSSPAVVWRKEIDVRLDKKRRAFGFAALRETGSTADAGFALFRRKRLIQGSADEGYRPEAIFGRPNSFTYQRLFGELHLDGFDVSHTKDGFRWEEHEEEFLSNLKRSINSAPLPLLTQAEEYRAKKKALDYKPVAEVVLARTAEVIEREVASVLEQQIQQGPDATEPPRSLPVIRPLAKRVIDLELHGTTWRVNLEFSADPAVGDWLEISSEIKKHSAKHGDVREISVRLALVHPFMERFGGTDAKELEPVIRIGAALALAEVAARDGGVKQAGTVRRNVNELLRESLSKP